MKKTLITGFVSASLAGLVFASQQSISILLSSFHDLAVFPKNSLIAIIFILFFHVLFFGLSGLGFGFLTRVFFKEKSRKEEIIISLSFGFAFGLVVFVFLFGRFQSVFFKIPVKLLLFSVSLGLGGISGLLIYPAVLFLQNKKKIFGKLKKTLAIFSFSLFGLLFSSLLIIALNHHLSGLPGLPKKPRINQSAGLGSPNIVLLTIDALRADHLGFMGYENNISPNLDLIAKKGVVFENTFTNAPWTLPSLATLNSSRLPTELKISVDNLSFGQIENSNFLTSQVETLAERMQTLGYNTQAILTNELLAADRGFSQGFDGFVNLEKLMPYHYQFHFKIMALTLLVNRIPGAERSLEKLYTFFTGPSGPKQFETRAWEINRWALPFLENYADSRFFLWLHYIDPHAPYDPGEDFSPNLSALESGRETELREASAHNPDRIRWREIDRQALVSLYDGDISLVDAAVGEIWQKMEDLGLTQNTILIISADHGEEFWDHGGLGHGKTFYTETIKIPLVVVGPQISAQRTISNVSLADLYPTIIDLAGGKQPQFLQGQSLKPILKGEELPAKDIISEGTGYGSERRAIIRGNLKLIHDYFTGENRLYDLVLDPANLNNMAPFYSQVVESLEAELESKVDEFRQSREEIFTQIELSPSFGDVVGY
ncbi:MAG: sulfatase [Candidatus Shapirobacteria bacterium]